MLLNVSISDDLSRVMAVSANRKAQAGKLHQREHRPLIWGILKISKESNNHAIFKFYPNPRHSKSSPNGNHPFRAGKPHHGRAVLRRRIYRQYGRNHRHYLRQYGRPFRPQHPHKCERKHGTPCHSHSNPSPPCGKLGIFRFIIRACGIYSKPTPPRALTIQTAAATSATNAPQKAAAVLTCWRWCLVTALRNL